MQEDCIDFFGDDWPLFKNKTGAKTKTSAANLLKIILNHYSTNLNFQLLILSANPMIKF